MTAFVLRVGDIGTVMDVKNRKLERLAEWTMVMKVDGSSVRLMAAFSRATGGYTVLISRRRLKGDRFLDLLLSREDHGKPLRGALVLLVHVLVRLDLTHAYMDLRATRKTHGVLKESLASSRKGHAKED